MARYLTVGAAGLALAWALTASPAGRADEPSPATTVVVTVTPRIEGKPIGWWRTRAVRNRRSLNHAKVSLRANRVLIRRLQHQARARISSSLSGLVSAFECIHSHEGAWNAHTGNGYENGLQMDRTFQRTYGSWALRRYGPAWAWPPGVQLVVGMTAYYDGRGFGPWPQTSRMCGLR